MEKYLKIKKAIDKRQKLMYNNICVILKGV